jgi:hypothetical protein
MHEPGRDMLLGSFLSKSGMPAAKPNIWGWTT